MPYLFLVIPYIVVLTAGLLSWWFLDPTSVAWVLGGITIGYLLAAWRLQQARSDWWRFAITPILLAVAGLLFSLLVSGRFSPIAVLAGIGLLEIPYWRYVYLYAARPGSYAPFSLERLSASLNFLTVYFLAAAAYGLKTFLDVPAWLITLSFALLIALLWNQWLWASKVSLAHGWRYAVVATIVLVELFWLQSFSPLDFRLLAFPLATGYYVLLNLMSLRLSGNLERRSLYALGAVMLASWVAVFLTAQWF